MASNHSGGPYTSRYPCAPKHARGSYSIFPHFTDRALFTVVCHAGLSNRRRASTWVQNETLLGSFLALQFYGGHVFRKHLGKYKDSANAGHTFDFLLARDCNLGSDQRSVDAHVVHTNRCAMAPNTTVNVSESIALFRSRARSVPRTFLYQLIFLCLILMIWLYSHGPPYIHVFLPACADKKFEFIHSKSHRCLKHNLWFWLFCPMQLYYCV